MFTKSQRTWDWISIFVLIVSIWIPAIRLRATNWAPNLDQVEFLGLLGACLGLWIGYSSFKKQWAHFLFLFFTAILPPWLWLSRLEIDGEWLQRLLKITGRLGASLTQFFAGLPVQDSVLFLFFCGFIMWILGYAAAFGLTRISNPWSGLLPATVIFGLVDFYDTTSTGQGWSGAILIFCLLLLAARLFWLQSVSYWKETGFLIERDAGESVMRITVIFSVILILFTWNLKGIIRSFYPGTDENRRVSQFWRQIQNQLENNFVALKPGTSLTGFYADGMRLGNQTPTSLTPAFQVTSSTFAKSVPQLYWRVRVYDTYQNGMWLSSPVTSEGSRLLGKDYLQNEQVFHEINLSYFWNEADGSLVPYPGRISLTDLAFNLKYITGDAVLPGDGLLFSERLLANGDQFLIRSQVFTGSAEDLQKVPENIPDWMKKRYLQIPETLPSRVRELSTTVAIGNTVFDRAEAITEFLRDQYVYRGQIPDVPSGRDPVDWFLFDQKSGFCNYFASAEVLLLRSAGIPARLAVGYSQGETIPGGFQVRLNNGHAWPEVYFQDIGWIPFEPTVTLPPTVYNPAGGNAQDDLALQLSQDERHAATELGGSVSGLGNSFPEEENSQFFTTETIAGIFFLGVLSVLSLYLMRSINRKPARISLPQNALAWFETRKVNAPGWIKTWAWYDGLSQPARQYYRLERLAIGLNYLERSAIIPTDLFGKLRKEFPDSLESINTFQNGLYSEIYSQKRLYDQDTCKTAGAALQSVLLKRLFLRWLNIK